MPKHLASDPGRSTPKAIFLPGEFVLGFIGRVRRLQGFATERATLNYLISVGKEALGGQTGDQWSYWDAVADYAGLSLNDLVSNHTLINFTAPALRSCRGEATKLSALRLSLKRLGLNTGIGPVPKFCQECRAAHQREMGYSYWQRHHQMAGRLLCDLHGTRLWRSTSVESYGHSPCDIQDAVQFDWSDDSEARFEQTRCLTRYNLIADAIDRTRRPISFKQLQRCIRGLAVDANVVVSEYVSAANLRVPHLNQVICVRLPKIWLEEMRFANSLNASGIFTGGLNTTTPSGTALATYFAVLWERDDSIQFEGDLHDLLDAAGRHRQDWSDQKSAKENVTHALRCNLSVALSQCEES